METKGRDLLLHPSFSFTPLSLSPLSLSISSYCHCVHLSLSMSRTHFLVSCLFSRLCWSHTSFIGTLKGLLRWAASLLPSISAPLVASCRLRLSSRPPRWALWVATACSSPSRPSHRESPRPLGYHAPCTCLAELCASRDTMGAPLNALALLCPYARPPHLGTGALGHTGPRWPSSTSPSFSSRRSTTAAPSALTVRGLVMCLSDDAIPPSTLAYPRSLLPPSLQPSS